MKIDIVAVRVGDFVRAGQQIGAVGSSGNSSGPHLHFGSMYDGVSYEPSTGCGNPGESGWEHQIPIRRDLYLLDFNLTNVRAGDYPGPPWDIPRAGSFVKGSQQSVGWWLFLCNVPARSNWKLLVTRPDGSLAYEAKGDYNNPLPYNFSYWWHRYFIDLDVVGTWHVEMLVNGKSLTKTPLAVVEDAGQIANRLPNDISAYFEPAKPNPTKPLFCRVRTSLVLDDPDYEVVRYRYQWFVNGSPVRDVVTAGQADCLPSYSFSARSVVKCIVTPMDGTSSGNPFLVQSPAAGPQPRKR